MGGIYNNFEKSDSNANKLIIYKTPQLHYIRKGRLNLFSFCLGN